MSSTSVSGVLYLRPADDFAVGFELRAVEDLDAGDGLHGLPVDGTDDAEQTEHTEQKELMKQRLERI